jgi:hypothetical protein
MLSNIANVKERKEKGLLKKVTNNSIDWPINAAADPAQHKIRVVRTKLFHKNGQVSQMIWHMPDYTMFIACHQEAVETMNEYIGYLASHWIRIEKYHTEFGVLKEDGSFAPCPVPFTPAMETIIVEGSVFIPGTKGKWVVPGADGVIEKGGSSC